MFGFRGLGYSPAFVQNMQAAVDAFFSLEGVRVEIVGGPDAICSACPHLQDGNCKGDEEAEERVRAKDGHVLDELGLDAGARLDSPSLARLVADRMGAAALARICDGCQWLPLGYCEEGLRSFRPGS